MEKHSRTRLADGGESRKKQAEAVEAEPTEEGKLDIVGSGEDPPPGIVCPKCSSDDHYVFRTVSLGDGRKRQRCCRKCGKRFETWEALA
jgi:hypothetical protein